MSEEKKTISIVLVYRGEEYQTQVARNEFSSLMSLISDRLGIISFGLCCGMGSCGTCLVRIGEKGSSLHTTTLACGVQINDYLANTRIEIEESSY